MDHGRALGGVQQPGPQPDQPRGPDREDHERVFVVREVSVGTNWPRRSPTSSITGPVRIRGRSSTTSDSNGSLCFPVDLAEDHLRVSTDSS